MIKLVIEDNKIKISELAKKLYVTKKTINRDIAEFKKHGLLKRVGSKKSGTWELMNFSK